MLALFDYRGFWLRAPEYHFIFWVLQTACLFCSGSLVHLCDVHIFWVSAIATGHQVAIVGPGQVCYMGGSCMGVAFGFVPFNLQAVRISMTLVDRLSRWSLGSSFHKRRCVEDSRIPLQASASPDQRDSAQSRTLRPAHWKLKST